MWYYRKELEKPTLSPKDTGILWVGPYKEAVNFQISSSSLIFGHFKICPVSEKERDIKKKKISRPVPNPELQYLKLQILNVTGVLWTLILLSAAESTGFNSDREDDWSHTI